MDTPTWTDVRRAYISTTSASSAPSRTRHDVDPSKPVKFLIYVSLYRAKIIDLAKLRSSNSRSRSKNHKLSRSNQLMIRLSDAHPILVLFTKVYNFQWESWAQSSQLSGVSFNFQPRHQSPSRRQTWLSDATRLIVNFRIASVPVTGRSSPVVFNRTR